MIIRGKRIQLRLLHSPQQPGAFPAHMRAADQRYEDCRALSILSVAIAFFPKCPVCWAAYLSVFGIAGLEQLPYSPWLLPLLASLMLINLGSLRLQQRSPQGPAGFYLATMGAFLILCAG